MMISFENSHGFMNSIGKVSSLTRLAIAIRVWSVETAKILASYMENPNAPNNNGKTPIQLAEGRGHSEIFKILKSLK